MHEIIIDSVAINNDLEIGFSLFGIGNFDLDEIKLFGYSNLNNNWDSISLRNFTFSESKSIPKHWQRNRTDYLISIENSATRNYVSLRYLDSGLMFDQIPRIDECINEKIGPHLYCMIPLTLYADEHHTYSGKARISIANLKKQLALNKTYPYQIDIISKVIITWNIFRHFWPYQDISDDQWDRLLSDTFSEIFRGSSSKDFEVSFHRFLGKIPDGHIFLQPDKAFSGVGLPVTSGYWSTMKLQ